MWLLALFGLFCGLAFLVKGFVAFAVAAVAIVPFIFWQRRVTDLLKIVWLPIITAALVTLPWSLLIYAREKDFWHYFFWTEHIQRFLSPSSAEHPEAFWFFIPCLVGGAFPWVVLLPCFPPLAILVSMALLRHFPDAKKKVLAPPAYLIAGIAATLAIAIILSRAITMDSPLYSKHEMWKAVIGVTGLLVYAFVLIAFCTGNAENFRKQILYFAAGPAILMFSGQFAVPHRLIEKKAPMEFLEQHKERIGPEDTLISDNYLASAVCWAYKHNDVFIIGRGGELEYGLRYDDSKHRLLDLNNLSEPGMTAPLSARITLITLSRRYVEYRHRLPKPLFEDIGDYFTFAEFVPSRVEADLSEPNQVLNCAAGGATHKE